MPGGNRGNIVDVAISLNESSSDQAMENWKCWIKGGYVVEASSNLKAAAESICKHKNKLQEIWNYALEHGRLDQVEY